MPLIEVMVLSVLGLGATRAVIALVSARLDDARSARLTRLAQIKMVRAPGAPGDETGDQTQW